MCQIEWHSNLIEKGEQLELGSEGTPGKFQYKIQEGSDTNDTKEKSYMEYKREVIQMLQTPYIEYKREVMHMIQNLIQNTKGKRYKLYKTLII